MTAGAPLVELKAAVEKSLYLGVALLIEAAGVLCLVVGWQARGAAFVMFLYLGVVSVLLTICGPPRNGARRHVDTVPKECRHYGEDC